MHDAHPIAILDFRVHCIQQARVQRAEGIGQEPLPRALTVDVIGHIGKRLQGTFPPDIEFCKGIQAAAPVDSYVEPEPWAMPGYDSDVIMAAGAFVQGSSIELSADGPIKPPYAVYFQGGLTWEHAKFGILKSLQKLVDAGIAKL